MYLIKEFKLFETEFVAKRPLLDTYIIDDLKDILVEIEDLGFENIRIWINEIRIKEGSIENESIERVEIEISKYYSDILPEITKNESSVIYEVLDRVIYYFRNLNFKYHVIRIHKGRPKYSEKEFKIDSIDRDSFTECNYVTVDIKK